MLELVDYMPLDIIMTSMCITFVAADYDSCVHHCSRGVVVLTRSGDGDCEGQRAHFCGSPSGAVSARARTRARAHLRTSYIL